MNIFKIEEYFDSPDHMNELLQYLQTEYFDKLDYQEGLFIGGALTSPGQVDSSITELTGIYMALASIYHIADDIKTRREVNYYMTRKIEIENKGDKFVSAAVEREASDHVAQERRVSTIIFGKLNGCDKAISTCQSKMKKDSKEIGMNK